MSTTTCRMSLVLGLVALTPLVSGEDAPIPWEQYLRESAVAPEVIERFLDDEAVNWARFDPELGYVLGSSFPLDGIDGTRTISTAGVCCAVATRSSTRSGTTTAGGCSTTASGPTSR